MIVDKTSTYRYDVGTLEKRRGSFNRITFSFPIMIPPRALIMARVSTLNVVIVQSFTLKDFLVIIIVS